MWELFARSQAFYRSLVSLCKNWPQDPVETKPEPPRISRRLRRSPPRRGFCISQGTTRPMAHSFGQGRMHAMQVNISLDSTSSGMVSHLLYGFTADPILAQRQAQSVTAYHLQCRGASPLEPTALQTRPYTVPSRPPAVNRPTDEVLLAFRLSAKLGTAELTDLRSTAGEHPYYILWNEASTTFNSQPRPGYDVKATMSMLSAFSAYP